MTRMQDYSTLLFPLGLGRIFPLITGLLSPLPHPSFLSPQLVAYVRIKLSLLSRLIVQMLVPLRDPVPKYTRSGSILRGRYLLRKQWPLMSGTAERQSYLLITLDPG